MNPEKLAKMAAQVRTGGKGSVRRKKKAIHKTTTTDDKRLQNTLKRLGVNNIPAIEEVRPAVWTPEVTWAGGLVPGWRVGGHMGGSADERRVESAGPWLPSRTEADAPLGACRSPLTASALSSLAGQPLQGQRDGDPLQQPEGTGLDRG